MEKVARLKDIAANLHISIGTVQKVLHNKGGYSDETKAKVLAEARRLNYSTNIAASSLKRSKIVIAAVLPKPEGENKFFFQYVWEGLDRACSGLSMFDIQIKRCYCDLYNKGLPAELMKILNNEYGKIDGVITNVIEESESKELLEKIAKRGILTFRLNAPSEFIPSGNGFSSSSNMNAGQLCADLLCSMLKTQSGQVLLLGGHLENKRHEERAHYFCRAMQQECPNVLITEIHLFNYTERLEKTIENYIEKFPDLIGIVAVSGRETLAMCNAVSAMKVSGKIATIGTDVFPELLPFFDDRTLIASIYYYPIQQAYSAVKAIVSDIAKVYLSGSAIRFPAIAIFRSNARAFCDMNADTIF